MAGKFTKKTNNKQVAYVLYMIISSYFHKSVCSNRWFENMLFLHYKDMPVSRQWKLEEKVIADVRKALKSSSSALSEMNCTVYINRQAGGYHLRFETGFESVSAVVDWNGNYIIRLIDGTTGSLAMSV